MNDSNPTSPTTAEQHPWQDLTVDQFLDRLSVYAGVVGGGERMRGASDAELQAWAWGIEDTQKNVAWLIAEWRKFNAGRS